MCQSRLGLQMRWVAEHLTERVQFGALAVVTALLLGSCTPPALQTGPLQRPPGQIALIVVADTPLRYIDVGLESGEQFPFYEWIFSAFRWSADERTAVFDDRTVVERALAKGIKPVVVLHQQNPIRFLFGQEQGLGNSRIAHLGVDDTQLESFRSVASELGASHIIKARLISNKSRVMQTLNSLGQSFSVVKRKMTVGFTVYDVARGEISFAQELTTAGFRSGLVGDHYIARNLTSAVIAAISAGGEYIARRATGTAMIRTDKTIRIGATWSRYGLYDAILTSISTVDGNLLRCDVSFWNRTDDRVRIILQKDDDGKLDTYITDQFNILYGTISSSVSEDSLDVRPGERKELFFVFPWTPIPTKQVSVNSTWKIQTTGGTDRVTVVFQDVPVP